MKIRWLAISLLGIFSTAFGQSVQDYMTDFKKEFKQKAEAYKRHHESKALEVAAIRKEAKVLDRLFNKLEMIYGLNIDIDKAKISIAIHALAQLELLYREDKHITPDEYREFVTGDLNEVFIVWERNCNAIDLAIDFYTQELFDEYDRYLDDLTAYKKEIRERLRLEVYRTFSELHQVVENKADLVRIKKKYFEQLARWHNNHITSLLGGFDAEMDFLLKWRKRRNIELDIRREVTRVSKVIWSDGLFGVGVYRPGYLNSWDRRFTEYYENAQGKWKRFQVADFGIELIQDFDIKMVRDAQGDNREAVVSAILPLIPNGQQYNATEVIEWYYEAFFARHYALLVRDYYFDKSDRLMEYAKGFQ